MKLAKIAPTNSIKPEPGYWNLILETTEDVEEYFSIMSQKQTEQLWDVLGHRKPVVYDPEETGIHRLIDAYITAQPAGKQIPVSDLCLVVDKMQGQKYGRMMTAVKQGKKIRCTAGGGYSYYDDFYKTIQEIECDRFVMFNYIFDKKNKAEKLIEYLTNKQFKGNTTDLMEEKTFMFDITIINVKAVRYSSVDSALCFVLEIKGSINTSRERSQFDIYRNLDNWLTRTLSEIFSKYFDLHRKLRIDKIERNESSLIIEKKVA